MISIWMEHGGEDDRDALIAELYEAGTLGVTEASGSLRAFFADASDTEALLTRFASHNPVVADEDPVDWENEWQRAWQPTEVGERFFMVPDWRDDAVPPGRLRLPVHPGMACGTGAHPCTQLCLEAMERWLPADSSVLDVGTGTGILAEAALLLGARQAIGCDADHDATIIAQANFALDEVDVPVFTGSLRSVRSEAFDAIVANLNANTVSRLSEDLWRVIRPGGVLILSGFHDDEIGSVIAGKSVRDELERDGWACVVL